MSRAKVRPCKKACGYPAVKGRQFCKWHVLMRSSSDVQAQAARARLGSRGEAYTNVARIPKSDWPDGERWCAGCQSFVPLFYCSGSRCKACANTAAHARRLETVYGIDPAEYQRIWDAQGRRCGICRNRPASIRFAVDHDHKTGEVRGILCKRCNHDLLGGGHDSLDVLWRAMVYLISPPAMRAPGWSPTDEHMLESLRLHLADQAVRAQVVAPRRPEPVPAPF